MCECLLLLSAYHSVESMPLLTTICPLEVLRIYQALCVDLLNDGLVFTHPCNIFSSFLN